MQTLDKGKDKLNQICDLLRNKTLEPAKIEAAEILEKAEHQKEHILAKAQQEATSILEKAHLEIEREKRVFQTSLEQASKQALLSLRQKIESDLFNPEIRSLVQGALNDTKTAARLIEAVLKGIHDAGVEGDIQAHVAKSLSASEVAKALAERVIERLVKQSVFMGDFEGGVKISWVDKKMTLDISDVVLRDFLGSFLRKDFAKILFKST